MTGHLVVALNDAATVARVTYEPPQGVPLVMEPLQCCAAHQRLRLVNASASGHRAVIALATDGHCPRDCEGRPPDDG